MHGKVGFSQVASDVVTLFGSIRGEPTVAVWSTVYFAFKNIQIELVRKSQTNMRLEVWSATCKKKSNSINDIIGKDLYIDIAM